MTDRERLTQAMEWARGPLTRTLEFALRGPRWVPTRLRRAPLAVLCRLLEAQVRYMRQ
jgi:hypothetical protein